jgi:hypothetical protein
VSGNLSVNGSSANEIPGGILLTTGGMLRGPRSDAGNVPIGLVFIKNESLTILASFDLITTNGEIDRDTVAQGATIQQNNNVYTYGFVGVGNGASNTAFLTVAIESASALRVRLRRLVITAEAGHASQTALDIITTRLQSIPTSGIAAAASDIARTQTASPTPLATVRYGGGIVSTQTITSRLSAHRIKAAAAPAAALSPYVDHDFSLSGILEAPLSDLGGSNGCGFAICSSFFNTTAMMGFIQWTEE